MSNIVSLVLIIASIGLFFGYIDPKYTDIQRLSAEKTERTKALNDAEKIVEKREKLLSVENEFSSDDLSRLSKLLPDNIDNVRLIIDIDEVAKKYSMRIRDFKTDTVKDEDIVGTDSSIYGTLSLSFSTSGSYETFGAFLKDLESSLRIIDVTSISFESAGNSNLYDFNVTIKTYWLK
jgi:Tfp pilus assembly protein PilO